MIIPIDLVGFEGQDLTVETAGFSRGQESWLTENQPPRDPNEINT